MHESATILNVELTSVNMMLVISQRLFARLWFVKLLATLDNQEHADVELLRDIEIAHTKLWQDVLSGVSPP